MAIPGAVTPGVQQAQELISQTQKQVKPGSPGFGQVLRQNAAQNTQAANQINQTNQVGQPNAASGVQVTPKTQTVPSAIKSLFNTWSKDQNSMHKVMQVALSGQNFNSSQLIMLQQATYKVSFELEAMSKLVEQASSAVKTTMQTQV